MFFVLSGYLITSILLRSTRINGRSRSTCAASSASLLATTNWHLLEKPSLRLKRYWPMPVQEAEAATLALALDVADASNPISVRLE